MRADARTPHSMPPTLQNFGQLPQNDEICCVQRCVFACHTVALKKHQGAAPTVLLLL